jgi:hypothetical protein
VDNSNPIQIEEDSIQDEPRPLEIAQVQEYDAPQDSGAYATSTPVPPSQNPVGSRQQTALPISGYAMYYNPNVMQEVLGNRLRMGHISACAECIGHVALLRPGDLNRRVWLEWSDGVVEGPFLVADVAASQHVASLLARNWVVDVDNRTAVRRRMAGPVYVTVWASPPAKSAQQTAPAAPVYAEPAATAYTVPPSPTFTPYPQVTEAPVAQMPPVQATFPTDTPVATATPLPSLYSVPSTVSGHLAAFPADTPVPTITPLPPVYSAPTVSAVQDKVVLPTVAPLATLPPTVTPAPPVATFAQPQAAFPPDTPTPTITPLPAIN